MSLERLQTLHTRLREAMSEWSAEPAAPEPALPAALGRELLESMLLARHLDRVALSLRARGFGHYTIGSSGHEGNVVLGRLTRPSDPALVHYRSAALQIERARAVPAIDPVLDIALSLVASSEEPTSHGRHKVFGRAELGIIPQTSTIASHLPRAIGLGFALEQRPRLGLPRNHPEDALVLASFGDASVNHSTALGAFNTASWTAHQKLPMPVLFVCEDNGLGISVRTPAGWAEARLRALPELRYFAADTRSLSRTFAEARAAIEYCRSTRRPAVLHLRCVRLLGHAGSDVDTSYRTPAELADAEARDPVLLAARELVAAGALRPSDVLALDEQCAARADAAAEHAITRPRLSSAAEVACELVRPITPEVAVEAERALRATTTQGQTLAQGLNSALAEALERYPEAMIFGEDVAKKGGVYGITKGLLGRAGPSRVFNTLLDEQTILGLALGAANLGLLPIPEIQYLAYLHNAEDQLRGEAATMAYFSAGAYDNPMLVRVAGLAYQKGFGGHFHNDNSLAVLRDIPGLIVGVPARADDAVAMVRTMLALARVARRVTVLIEPIALYHQRDLHRDGDGGWLAPLPPGAAEFGRARLYPAAAPASVLLVTYGNGTFLGLRAARRLADDYGVHCEVLDLRWLAPLPLEDFLQATRRIGRVLMVDECRRSGNVSEALGAALLDAGLDVAWARVTSADCFIPLGDAARLVLVEEQAIVDQARQLAERARPPSDAYVPTQRSLG